MAVHALPQPGLSREERIGLGVAILAHVALVAWLWLEPLGKDVQAPPERMTVSFADEVALEATAPAPQAEAALDTAPALGEAAPEPEPVIAPAPEPKLAMARPKPNQPAARPTTRPSARPAATDPRKRRRPDAPRGASKVDSDFLDGIPGGESRTAPRIPPAARAGPQVAASLRQAVARQLKPNWVAPQGAEVELLRTTISWSLNSDGSIAGTPELTNQEGVTEANRAQARRHVEQAIRAIRLAAPFDLPEEYYASWKRLRFTFDRNLSR